MDFHETYAALRHGIVMARVWAAPASTSASSPMPDDPDDLVLHRALLERMLS
ncbi:hypothetical protein GCM10020219_105030 [Nonomuraea dietziae]